MALFRLKKDTEEKKTSEDVVVSDTKKEKKETKKAEPKKTAKKVEKKTSSDILSFNYKKDMPSVLKNPRVTEKATLQSEKGVYVFNVAPRSTKKDVAEAVEALYKVIPRKINMVKVPSKRVRMRGKQNKYGVKSGGKKAYVYVKKGDTIDIV
ncbi:50S ribosomal protein L23 [candidate division KSB1 bacterium]